MAKKKEFKLSENKRPPRPKIERVKPAKIEDAADQPPYFIRGIEAGSKEEYWVSLALEKIQEITGWGWDYQVPVFGGRQIRGGNIVDFLVYTPGPWTAIEPKGRYWHTGRNEDQNEMREACQKKGWRLIEWFTDQTRTKEEVLSLLKRELYL